MSYDSPSHSGQSGQLFIRLLIAVVVGAIAMSFIAIRGCQRGPFGRKQIVTQMSDEQEIALGAQAYREVLKGTPEIRSGPIVAEVKAVTDRLIRATENREFLRLTHLKDRKYAWEVRVVRSREVNAFCLPGGKMVVYTGILPVCQTDAGLATVMGHEISHALAQHGLERMAHQKMAQIGVLAGGATLGDMNPRERATVIGLLSAGAQMGVLKYSREHESEADHMGLLLMAAAGYNPKAAAKFWERMAAASKGGRTPEFLSTHPSHETRIRDLMKWAPEAMPLYEASEYAEERPRKLRLE